MVPGIRGDVNDLAAEHANQRAVLAFRVDDNNITVASQEQRHDLRLSEEALAGTGHAEHESVAVQHLLAVHKEQILADDVLPTVDTVLVVDLLRLEGHEHRGGLRCQGAQRVDLS